MCGRSSDNGGDVLGAMSYSLVWRWGKSKRCSWWDGVSTWSCCGGYCDGYRILAVVVHYNTLFSEQVETGIFMRSMTCVGIGINQRGLHSTRDCGCPLGWSEKIELYEVRVVQTKYILRTWYSVLLVYSKDRGKGWPCFRE